MRRIFKSFFTGITGFIFLFGCVSFVCAKESSTEEFTLEEITVTAQKREEDVQKVPLAIDTISGYELTEMGKTTLEEALASLPSVIVQRMGNRLNVSIRGVDNDYSPDVSNSMVAVTYDGTYSSVAGIDASGLYDSSRIEVLSGPQGTLYSRASTGGVVNIVSNNPTEKQESSASIEVGNYDLLNTQGMVNVPLNDKFAFRAAFSTQLRKGYISNGTDDNDTKAARVKLKYDANEDLSFLFAVDYVRMGGKGQGENSPFAVGVKMFEDQPDDAWVSVMDGKDFTVNRKTRKFYMEMNWDLGFGTLTFLPSVTRMNQELYSGINYRGTITYTHAFGFQKEYSGEVRLASPNDAKIKWLGGIYSYTRNYQYLSLETSGEINWRNYRNPSIAGFGNTTVPITDRFRFNLGARWTQDRADALTVFTPAPVGMVNAPMINKTNFFDYKGGVEYDLAKNSMLWADYSTGHRAGMRGWPDETLNAYQIGSKNRFMDNRLQLNGSFYYYAYLDYQINAPMREYTYTVDGVEYTTMDRGDGSGGEATIYGLELATSYILTQKDRVDFTASYQNSEVSSLTFDYEYSDSLDVSGGRLNNSPEYTIFGSYQHEFPLSNGGNITARVESRYQTETKIMMNAIYNESILSVPAGMTVDGVNTEPAHHISNASIKFDAPSGTWNLNGYIKNIENHAIKKNLLNGALRIGPPRTYGIVLSVQF